MNRCGGTALQSCTRLLSNSSLIATESSITKIYSLVCVSPFWKQAIAGRTMQCCFDEFSIVKETKYSQKWCSHVSVYFGKCKDSIAPRCGKPIRTTQMWWYIYVQMRDVLKIEMSTFVLVWWLYQQSIRFAWMPRKSCWAVFQAFTRILMVYICVCLSIGDIVKYPVGNIKVLK